MSQRARMSEFIEKARAVGLTRLTEDAPVLFITREMLKFESEHMGREERLELLNSLKISPERDLEENAYFNLYYDSKIVREEAKKINLHTHSFLRMFFLAPSLTKNFAGAVRLATLANKYSRRRNLTKDEIDEIEKFRDSLSQTHRYAFEHIVDAPKKKSKRNTFTPNQISRYARLAVRATATPENVKRTESSEPLSKFVAFVDANAFSPKNTKHSIVYHATGERFPYLQMLAASADFGFLTPPQIAALYVVARTRPDDWHVICEQRSAMNFSPRGDLVEDVNAYFKAAGAPQHDELHEMHQMFDEFLPHSDALLADGTGSNSMKIANRTKPATVAFLAFSGAFCPTLIGGMFREHGKLLDGQQAAPNETMCALIMRSFTLSTQWFARQ